MKDLNDERKDMTPLFETIVNYIPAPTGDPDANTQILISTIDYNEYVGRIGIGKVDNGKIKVNQEAVVVNHHDPDKLEKVRISKLYEFDGLDKVDVAEANIGSIVAISGIADIHIGDTICSPEAPEAIPFQKISEPTISMNFIVNNSPLAGQEGKFVTSRHIRDRLLRELNTDVSLRVRILTHLIPSRFPDVESFTFQYLSRTCAVRAMSSLLVRQRCSTSMTKTARSLSQWSLLTSMCLTSLQELSSQSFSNARASLEIWVLSQVATPDSSSISLHVDLSDTVVSS